MLRNLYAFGVLSVLLQSPWSNDFLILNLNFSILQRKITFVKFHRIMSFMTCFLIYLRIKSNVASQAQHKLALALPYISFLPIYLTLNHIQSSSINRMLYDLWILWIITATYKELTDQFYCMYLLQFGNCLFYLRAQGRV